MDKIRRYFLFFFQAEDGIRDGRVTGVQTCALPISRSMSWRFRTGSLTAPPMHGDSMSRMTNHDPDTAAEDEFEGPSKSLLKRQSAELQRLGEALIELAPPELDALDLPEKLRDAVDLAK